LFLKKRNIVKTCNEEVKKYNIKTPSLRQTIKNLSGGNQQKVLVARWLLLNSDIIIVDEPTRGIDVGAKAEIHRFLTKLAQQGKSVIMISSELPEILGMSDRIIVMHEGHVTGILNRCEADQANIMNYATGLARNCG
jgi:ABC-type sugar transport system ATPase subunit